MNDHSNSNSMPLGLGMALAQYPDAMKYFANLSPEAQATIISQVRDIHSRRDMQAFVQTLGSGGANM